MIAIASLVVASLVLGLGEWPARQYRIVALAAVMIGVGYTVYSEWFNVYVRGAWSYSDLMPLIPWTGVGLSPVLQWFVVPIAGLVWIRRAMHRLPVHPQGKDDLAEGRSHAGS
jgi:hypothetical protein